MVLNVFAHAAGLEVESLFDDSVPPISGNMSEYTDEPTDLSVQKIPPATVDNDIGKVARIRRVSVSKESSGYYSNQVFWQIVSSDPPIDWHQF